MAGRYPIFDDPRVIEYVAGCMARGVKKYALKADIESICKRKCDSSIYEKLRRKAREVIREDANKEISDFRDNAIGTLQEIVADENTAAKDKILAQKELNNILGIGHQFKQIESTEGKAKKLRDFLKATDNNITEGDNCIGNLDPTDREESTA